jgi:hypothetical protein
MTATGVGALRLGMTAAEAEATGLLDPSSRTPSPRNPDCLWYTGRDTKLSVSVGKLGVSRIAVHPFIHTPQGVAVGDSYLKAQAVYPSLPVTPDRREIYQVPAPGGTGTWYTFDLEPTSPNKPPTGQTRIEHLSLSNDDPSCA